MNTVLLDILALTAIYSIVTLGQNVITGYAGIFSVALAAIFGAGAFTYSGIDLLGDTTNVFIVLPAAIVVGGLISGLIALVAMRVQGDFLIVASFGLQLVIIQVAYNWQAVSGGGAGAFGLSAPVLFGHSISGMGQWLALILVIAVLIYGLATWIVRAPFGRLLRAMRDDDAAVQAAGFDSRKLRLSAFVFGGAVAAVGGALYAGYQGVAQTGDFGVATSITLLAAVIIGGSGSLIGSIVGAFLFVGAPRLMNLISVPDDLTGPLQQLAFGVLVIAVVAVLPGGLSSVLNRLVRRGPVKAAPSATGGEAR